ncbi:MAG: hypothetical protein ACYC0J_10130 [Gammaproteobacteria bacterium]
MQRNEQALNTDGWLNTFLHPITAYEQWRLVTSTVKHYPEMSDLSDKAYLFLANYPDKLPLVKKLQAIHRLDNFIWDRLTHNAADQFPSFLPSVDELFANDMLCAATVDMLIQHPSCPTSDLIKGYQALKGLNGWVVMDRLVFSPDDFFTYFPKSNKPKELKKLISLLSSHYTQLEWMRTAGLLSISFFKTLMKYQKTLFHFDNGSDNILAVFYRHGLIPDIIPDVLLKRLSLVECQILVQMDALGLLDKNKILSWWPTPAIYNTSPIEFLADLLRYPSFEEAKDKLPALATRLFHYELNDDFSLFRDLCEKAKASELESEHLSFEELLKIYDAEIHKKTVALKKINHSSSMFQAAPSAPPLPIEDMSDRSEVLNRRRAPARLG